MPPHTVQSRGRRLDVDDHADDHADRRLVQNWIVWLLWLGVDGRRLVEHARELAARLLLAPLLAPLIARATPSIADGLHDLGVLAGDRRGGKRALEGAVRVSHRRRTLAGWTVWGVSLWSNGRNARTGGGLRDEITNTEPDQLNTALAFPLTVTPGDSPGTPRAGKDPLAI